VQFLARQRQAIDVSLGGVRIFSDDAMRVGELLKMEFFVPDAEPVTYTAEVVWVDELGSEGAPAQFDVGLKFLQLEPAALRLLVSVLGPLEGEDDGAPAEIAEGGAAPPDGRAVEGVKGEKSTPSSRAPGD
jgi:hypothetical protein